MSRLDRVTAPFTISLPDAPGGAAAAVRCDSIVRRVSGSRLVCSGTWGGRDVFVKIYLNRWRARRQWRREEHGVRALAAKGIAVPALLHAAHLPDDGAYVLVFEAIAPAETVEAWWRETHGTEARAALLRTVLAVLADHHRHGFVQTDLHLANFLASGERIYTLDASEIEVRGEPLDRRQSMENLLVLFCTISSALDPMLAEQYDEYVERRGWTVEAEDQRHFRRRLAEARRAASREYLGRKIFRGGTRYRAQRTWTRRLVVDRDEDGDELRALLDDPDRVGAVTMPDGRRLHVSRFTGATVAPRRSPAANAWRMAHLLPSDDVTVARPVAMQERRFGPVTRSGVLVTELAAGAALAEHLRSPSVGDDEKARVATRVVEVFRTLQRLHLVHGRAETLPFVVAEGEPVLIGLDAMREVVDDATLAREHQVEIDAFLAPWEDRPDLAKLFHSLRTQAK